LTENVVGTYPYMPNECEWQRVLLYSHAPSNLRLSHSALDGQDLEDGRVSEKTDAFAMGIVLVELLTGMDSMDARVLAEKEGDEYLAAAAYKLARQ
jgi:hypothetical protein